MLYSTVQETQLPPLHIHWKDTWDFFAQHAERKCYELWDGWHTHCASSTHIVLYCARTAYCAPTHTHSLITLFGTVVFVFRHSTCLDCEKLDDKPLNTPQLRELSFQLTECQWNRTPALGIRERLYCVHMYQYFPSEKQRENNEQTLCGVQTPILSVRMQHTRHSTAEHAYC